MARSEQHIQGKRAGLKWAITWLHQRALTMNDPHARGILNSAAFDLGIEIRTDNLRPIPEEGSDGIRWARVNAEPFEYAIQQGRHGDEFVKLLNGTHLRRSTDIT